MTGDRYGIEMTADEVAAFLQRRGHGVLSFGGGDPYAVPVSFGYDDAGGRVVFQLVFFPDSEKHAHVAAADRATLVAHEWRNPDDWRSVIVSGRLRPVAEDDVDAVAAAGVFAAHAAPVDLAVFNRPSEDLAPEWYELVADDVSGYRAPAVDA